MKRRSTIGFLFFFIFIVVVLGFMNTNQETFGKTQIENLEPTVNSECIVKENNECLVFITNSIADIDNIVTSDETFVEQFLSGSQLLDSKFGIETVTLLIDPFGNTKKSSDILNIPSFAVLTGNSTLDLSDLKTSFYFITKDKLQSIKVEGDVEFYLDDSLITKKKIFVSGNTILNKTIQMSLADSSFAPFSQRKDGFGFTFKDEIPKWEDNTSHDFRVVIKDITGEVIQESQQPKTVRWVGEHIAYELEMLYEDSKLAVITDNQVKLEFKKDTTIATCGLGNDVATLDYARNPSYRTFTSTIKAISPDIEVYQNNKLITKLIGTVGSTGTNNCNKFVGLERNADYVFKINGKSYDYITSEAQQNIFVQCQLGDVRIGDHNPSNHDYYIIGFGKKICTSNFGYNEVTVLIP